MNFDDRPDTAKRLERARVERGFKTAKEAATYYGWSYHTYAQHENGIRGIGRAADKYADAFKVGKGWLLAGEGRGPKTDDIGPRSVPIKGYVAAGEAASFYTDDDSELDRVPPPEGSTKDTVAVEIRGQSLGPLFDTWLIFYGDRREPITPDLIGRLCVVGLSDGRVLVKRILRAKTPGLFHLQSNTTEPMILDVAIDWAAPVTDMKPRY